MTKDFKRDCSSKVPSRGNSAYHKERREKIGAVLVFTNRKCFSEKKILCHSDNRNLNAVTLRPTLGRSFKTKMFN